MSPTTPDPAADLDVAPVLYVRRTCGFCHRVLRHASRVGVALDVRDIGLDDRHRRDLVRIGGLQQVPCLVHRGVALYESADIVDWLDARHRARAGG